MMVARRAHNAAHNALVASPIPSDAAAWLTAHFDWSYGAVWVAAEQWRVDATTVVAWAERLRCGGARAGLGTRERTWVLAQLCDPEQRPSAVEMAMARTYFRGQETTPPLRITSIDDAIALIEAQLAEDADDRTTRDERELRELLLDDLRVLRQQQRHEQRMGRPITDQVDEMTEPDEQREEERQPTMASPNTTTTTATTTATNTPTYETREALCAYCGKPFTARKYSYGWTTYCGSACSGRARHSNLPKRSEPVTPPPIPEHEPTHEPTHEMTTKPVTEPDAMPTAKDLYHEALAAYNAAQEGAQEGTPEPEPEPDMVVVSLQQTHSAIDRLRALYTDQADEDSADSDGQDSDDTADDDAVQPSYPLLRALIDRLPTGGMWSGQARARWLRAFEATLDLDVWTADGTEGE